MFDDRQMQTGRSNQGERSSWPPCKEVWWPVIGQMLSVFSEPNNRHDRRAVAIGVTVGHYQGSMQISSRRENMHDRQVALNNEVRLITRFYGNNYGWKQKGTTRSKSYTNNGRYVLVIAWEEMPHVGYWHGPWALRHYCARATLMTQE